MSIFHISSDEEQMHLISIFSATVDFEPSVCIASKEEKKIKTSRKVIKKTKETLSEIVKNARNPKRFDHKIYL